MPEKYNILIARIFLEHPTTTLKPWLAIGYTPTLATGPPPTFASTNGENQGKTPTIQGQQKANGARIFCSKTYTFADEWRLLHNKGANHNGPKGAPSIQQKHENDD